MAELTTPEVLRRRIATQRLAGNPLPTATGVVRLLTCVQSQEWAHAFWSLGMRTVGLTHADVQAEFDAGRILRTHTKSQAREAVAAVAHRLERVVADGTELWFDPQPVAEGGKAGTDALLVPLFDELTLSYPTINFPVAEGHPHRPGDDLFVGCVLLDLTNVGLWRRVVQGPKVIMEVTLVPAVSSAGRGRIEAAAERLAAFLGKCLELTIAG
jgi:Winged helix DNA-binding domain